LLSGPDPGRAGTRPHPSFRRQAQGHPRASPLLAVGPGGCSMTTLDERHGDGARDGDGQGGVPIHWPPGFAAVSPRSTHAEAVPLSDPRALPFAGSKAANLARAPRCRTAGASRGSSSVIPEVPRLVRRGRRRWPAPRLAGPLRFRRHAPPRRTVLLTAGGHPGVVPGGPVRLRARRTRLARVPYGRADRARLGAPARRPRCSDGGAGAADARGPRRWGDVRRRPRGGADRPDAGERGARRARQSGQR
jgi:hypothetical protein